MTYAIMNVAPKKEEEKESKGTRIKKESSRHTVSEPTVLAAHRQILPDRSGLPCSESPPKIHKRQGEGNMQI